MSELFKLILKRKGLDESTIESLFSPIEGSLANTETFIDTLASIKKANYRIVVHPDIDMDGITSGTICYAALSELGFYTGLHIPDYKRGHGLFIQDVDEILEQFPDAKYIITTDTGITSHPGINYAISKGLKVLVTDHHKDTDGTVAAEVIIDPAASFDPYPFDGICGAQVIQMVMEAYTAKYQPEATKAIGYLRVFAGMGVISDVMPLLHQNRDLVAQSVAIAKLLYVEPNYIDDFSDDHGFRIAKDPRTTVKDALLLRVLGQSHSRPYLNAFEGLALLLHQFTTFGKLREGRKSIDSGFYGFYLSPVFNTVRRIETSMAQAFDVFNSDHQLEAITAMIIDNEQRKALTPVLTEQVLADEQPYAPYIYFADSAPKGMLGLLASKLMNTSHLPTCVIHRPAADNHRFGGSARSPIWYPLNTIVNAAGFHALGHENACGVYVAGQADLPLLHQLLESTTEDYRKAASSSDTRTCHLRLGFSEMADGPIMDLEAITELVQEIESLAPYGHEFTAPIIELEVDLSRVMIRAMGNQQQHLNFVLPNGIKAPWWNAAEKLESLRQIQQAEESLATLTGSFALNNFRDNISIQFMLDDLVQGI